MKEALLMREVHITTTQLARLGEIDKYPGRALVFPVKVNWPELQLTEGQVVANALALADGAPIPYPDPSIFDVVLER